MEGDWLEVFILGVVQGISEFLPISSSGHLTLLQQFMGIREPQLLLDIVLHAGTLGALLIVFRRDIFMIVRGLFEECGSEVSNSQPAPAKVLIYIALGTLVTGSLGLGLHDYIENLYGGIGPLGPCWIFTGLMLWITRGAPYGRQRSMGAWDAMAVGFAQALALAPGISRSGITIATALLLGWDRRWAATFSFLLSIPATLGALFLGGWRGEIHSVEWVRLFLGGVAAMIVGLISLRWLVKLVLRGRIYRFAWYCWFMGGAVGLIWVLSRVP